MKVLVTGGGGFAGVHLLRELRRVGVEDLAATLLGELPPAAEMPEDLAGVEWLSMDVGSRESVREVVERVRPEQVYHLAGQASVGASFRAPLATWEVNATGTLRLMQALAEISPRPRRLLLTSSAEVYGAVPGDRQPVAEDWPFRPLTPYGASKAAAEVAALQAGAASGIEVIVSRSFNHIGPGQDERFVLPSMARQLVEMRSAAERVLWVGNLSVDRDFLDVRDVARAYALLMNEGEAGLAYNVCSGLAHPLADVVGRLVELSGTGAELSVDPERVRPADIPSMVGDAARLRALGWAPRFSLDETLSDLLQEAEAKHERRN